MKVLFLGYPDLQNNITRQTNPLYLGELKIERFRVQRVFFGLFSIVLVNDLSKS